MLFRSLSKDLGDPGLGSRCVGRLRSERGGDRLSRGRDFLAFVLTPSPQPAVHLLVCI